jgi:hypothetical protein
MGRREHKIASIVYMTHLAAVGPFFPQPPVALFPALPLSFIAWSSKSAVAASSGFTLLLLLLVLVLWQFHLTGCWSMFDACCWHESAVAFMGALGWGFGAISGVVVG